MVGYEGHKKWLGRWGKAVEAECQRRGWEFVINPPDLRSCDILVAFRDGQWDGWMCREWKSGIKLVNAMAAGRPIMAKYSRAADEILVCGERVDALEELAGALDVWDSYDDRCGAVQFSADLFGDYTLNAIAKRYRNILEGVVKAKAA